MRVGSTSLLLLRPAASEPKGCRGNTAVFDLSPNPAVFLSCLCKIIYSSFVCDSTLNICLILDDCLLNLLSQTGFTDKPLELFTLLVSNQ